MNMMRRRVAAGRHKALAELIAFMLPTLIVVILIVVVILSAVDAAQVANEIRAW